MRIGGNWKSIFLIGHYDFFFINVFFLLHPRENKSRMGRNFNNYPQGNTLVTSPKQPFFTILHNTIGWATSMPFASLFSNWHLTPLAPFHHFYIPNRWWCHIWTLPRMAMLVLWKLWSFKCSNPKFRSSLHVDKENDINNVSQKMTTT